MNTRVDTPVLEIRYQKLIVCVVLLDILRLAHQSLESLVYSIPLIPVTCLHPLSQHCLNCQIHGHLKDTQWYLQVEERRKNRERYGMVWYGMVWCGVVWWWWCDGGGGAVVCGMWCVVCGGGGGGGRMGEEGGR